MDQSIVTNNIFIWLHIQGIDEIPFCVLQHQLEALSHPERYSILPIMIPRRLCKSAIVSNNNQIILCPGPDQGQMTRHRMICKVDSNFVLNCGSPATVSESSPPRPTTYSFRPHLHFNQPQISTMELSVSRQSAETDSEDVYTPFSFRNHFQSSYCNIQTWAAHVQLATASLPTLTILPSAHRRFIGRYYGQNNYYFQTSLHIPNGISKDIRFYIATTINKQSPWAILEGLPHPDKAPLVSNVCLVFLG